MRDDMEHLQTAATAASAAGGALGAAGGTKVGAALLGASAGVGAGLGAAVVIAYQRPRTDAEWVSAIIGTVISSFGGGAAAILHLNLIRWVLTPDPIQMLTGLMALGGVFFACALPGWWLVRVAFNTMQKRKDQDFPQIADEFRGK
jgi:hypothetical protein